MRVQLNNGIGSKRKLIISGMLIFSFWVGLLYIPSPTEASGLTPDTLIISLREAPSTPIKLVDDTREDDPTKEIHAADLVPIETVVETTDQEMKQDQAKTQSVLESVLDTRSIETIVDKSTKDLQIKVKDLQIKVDEESPIADNLGDHFRSGVMLPEILDHPVAPETFMDNSFLSSVLEDVNSDHHDHSDRKQPAPLQHVIMEQTPPSPRSSTSDGPAFSSVLSMYGLCGEQIVPNAGTESAYDHQVRLAADQWSKPPPYQPRIISFFSQMTSRIEHR